MNIPIDTVAAHALTADLYRQLTKTKQELSATQQRLAVVTEQYERLAATVRASAEVPEEESAPPS